MRLTAYVLVVTPLLYVTSVLLHRYCPGESEGMEVAVNALSAGWFPVVFTAYFVDCAVTVTLVPFAPFFPW